MIRVAIVEDAESDRKILRGFLKLYQDENKTFFEIFEFCDGQELLAAYPQRLNLLLMDIQMEYEDGLETARRVREFDSEVTLIFITNMIQYALEGYRVDALNFLVKPVGYPAFSAEVARALKRIASKSGIALTIRNSDGIFTVDSADIGYIEAFNHKTILHTKSRVIPAGQTMVSFQNMLAVMPFFRCHSAFLVNMDRVERVFENDVWIFGQRLPVSKHRRKAFLEAYAAHMGKIL